MSPGNKNAPPSPVLASHLAAGPRRPVPLGARAQRRPFNLLLPLPRCHCRKKANHISVTSSVQKRTWSACGGLREAATRKVLCGGATELAGFTRAVTKHLLSAVPPRSRLPRARLPLVWHCLFFHRLFSLFSSLPFFFLFGAASSSTGPAPASRSFWYRAPLPYGSSSPLFERPTFRSRLFIPSYYVCSPRDVIDTY